MVRLSSTICKRLLGLIRHRLLSPQLIHNIFHHWSEMSLVQSKKICYLQFHSIFLFSTIFWNNKCQNPMIYFKRFELLEHSKIFAISAKLCRKKALPYIYGNCVKEKSIRWTLQIPRIPKNDISWMQ